MFNRNFFVSLKPGDVFSFLNPSKCKNATVKIFLGENKWLCSNNEIDYISKNNNTTKIFIYLLQHE